MREPVHMAPPTSPVLVGLSLEGQSASTTSAFLGPPRPRPLENSCSQGTLLSAVTGEPWVSSQ